MGDILVLMLNRTNNTRNLLVSNVIQYKNKIYEKKEEEKSRLTSQLFRHDPACQPLQRHSMQSPQHAYCHLGTESMISCPGVAHKYCGKKPELVRKFLSHKMIIDVTCG